MCKNCTKLEKQLKKFDAVTTPKPYELFEYIKRRKNGKVIKVGIMLGIQAVDEIRISFSKCNFKAGDKFDFAKGYELATRRAYGEEAIPTSKGLRKQLRKFGSRCVRYFQDATLLRMPDENNI